MMPPSFKSILQPLLLMPCTSDYSYECTTEQHLPLRSFINLPVKLTVVILMPFKAENVCCIPLNIYSKVVSLAGLNGSDSQENKGNSWFYIFQLILCTLYYC